MKRSKKKYLDVDFSIFRVTLGLFFTVTGLLGLFYPTVFAPLLIVLVVGVFLLSHPSIREFTDYTELETPRKRASPRKVSATPRLRTAPASKAKVAKKTKKTSSSKAKS